MRDVVPASEQQLADAAAEALDRAGSPDSQLTSSFDWGAANTALTRLAASGGSAGNSSSKSGSGGGDGILLQPGASGDDSSTAAALGLPPELRLVGRERRSPLGRAWAAVWRGPQHIVFGHDASRRLQVRRRCCCRRCCRRRWASGLCLPLSRVLTGPTPPLALLPATG